VKRKILASLIVGIGLMILTSHAYAMDIEGWWAVRMNFIKGDFQTGEWTTLLGYGSKVGYMYITNAEENSYGGPSWLFLWDDSTQQYVEETYPVSYIRNGVILFFTPTIVDQDGNYYANTILLRPYGSANSPYLMKGYYTFYDTENLVTPEQFIRMGTLFMGVIQPQNVPTAVQDLLLSSSCVVCP
jgi:hypothetical protein